MQYSCHVNALYTSRDRPDFRPGGLYTVTAVVVNPDKNAAVRTSLTCNALPALLGLLGLAGLATLLAWPPAARAQQPVQRPCPVYGPATKVGRITDPRITEISGLAASATNPGILWLHNDSGDDARLFAVGTDGATRAVYVLPSAAAIDWEDIAIGPGPRAGVDYLYIGDIGDNGARRSHVTIYRVAEPRLSQSQPPSLNLSRFTTFRLEYPDGPRDAEVLLSDPTSGDLFIVSKDFANGESSVYRFGYPHKPASSTDGRNVLELVGHIRFRGMRASDIAATAGDVSPGGDTVIVRTYTQALVWRRASHTRLAHELMTAPCPVHTVGIGFPFDQYEAIAYAPDGASYYTVSEGNTRSIYKFDLRSDLRSAPRTNSGIPPQKD